MQPIQLPFSEFPTLSSQRLKLREILPSDSAAIMEISVYDGVFAQSEAEALVILERIQADVARGESLHWGICLLGSDEIVGTCGFYRGFAGNVGEIGYILRPAYRGQGLMSEAVDLVTDFGLSQMNLREVVAYTTPDNLASVATLKRCGYKEVPSENQYLKFSRKPT